MAATRLTWPFCGFPVMRFSLRKLFVAVSVICVVAAAIGFFVSLQFRIEFWYRGNSISWVAQMLVRHLENNDDNWPTSWDDLEDDYGPVVRRYGQPWTFQGLRENVELDWKFDNSLGARDGRIDRTRLPLKMIVPSDVFAEREAEANAVVFDYLDSKRAE
jgi:hypothetical protein